MSGVADFGTCVVLRNVHVALKTGCALCFSEALFAAFEAEFTSVVSQVAEVFLGAG